VNATAALAALPPVAGVTCRAWRFSPLPGMRGVSTMISMTMEPMTAMVGIIRGGRE